MFVMLICEINVCIDVYGYVCVCVCLQGDMNDKEAAVKMKMFGKLTRDTIEWHPDKLLCKRFNVPDPYPG